MKRILLLLTLVATTALVLFLLKPGGSDPIVFEQRSGVTVFNIKGPPRFKAFLEHGLKVASSHPNPQTIVRIAGNNEPLYVSNLKIESPGDVYFVNPGGFVVGKTAHLELGNPEAPVNLLPRGSGKNYVDLNTPEMQAEIIQNGNIYALAVRKSGGAIRAYGSNGSVQKPTTFDYPDLEESLIFSDE